MGALMCSLPGLLHEMQLPEQNYFRPVRMSHVLGDADEDLLQRQGGGPSYLEDMWRTAGHRLIGRALASFSHTGD